jgi:hypothetical protein
MGHMKFAVHSQFFITSRWDHPFAHHGNGVELYTYLLYLAIYLALGVQHRFFFFFFFWHKSKKINCRKIIYKATKPGPGTNHWTRPKGKEVIEAILGLTNNLERISPYSRFCTWEPSPRDCAPTLPFSRDVEPSYLDVELFIFSLATSQMQGSFMATFVDSTSLQTSLKWNEYEICVEGMMSCTLYKG